MWKITNVLSSDLKKTTTTGRSSCHRALITVYAMLLVVQTSGLEAALGHRLTSDGWWCSIDLRVVENLPQINESCDGEQTPPFTSPHVNKAALSTRCIRLYLRNVKSKCVRRMFNGTHTHTYTHQRTLHAVIQVLVDVFF